MVLKYKYWKIICPISKINLTFSWISIWNILNAVLSYDINVLKEIYSIILRIYKWGYLRGANKGSRKKVAWLRGGWGWTCCEHFVNIWWELTVRQMVVYTTLLAVFKIRKSGEPELSAAKLRRESRNGRIMIENTKFSVFYHYTYTYHL